MLEKDINFILSFITFINSISKMIFASSVSDKVKKSKAYTVLKYFIFEVFLSFFFHLMGFVSNIFLRKIIPFLQANAF